MVSARIIREVRRRAGLTQAQLADLLATTQSALARWEQGRTTPSLETVIRIVRACGLDLTISLATRDDDHARLIDEYVSMTPDDRLADLLDRIDVEAQLHAARPVG